MIGRYVWPAAGTDQQAALTLARTEADRAGADYKIMEQRAQTLEREQQNAQERLTAAIAEVAQLTERAAGLAHRFDAQAELLRAPQVERDSAAAEAKTATADIARLKERETELLPVWMTLS